MARRVLCGQASFLAAGMQCDWRKVEEAGGSLFLTETAREVQEEASRSFCQCALNPWKPHWLPLLPACKLQTHKPTAHMGLRATPGEENTLQHPPPRPFPSHPGPTCHQLLPAERHGASQQVGSSGFPRGCVLFLFGRPAPVWVTICILPGFPETAVMTGQGSSDYLSFPSMD